LEEGSAATPLKRFHALNLLAVLMINEKNDYGHATGLLQESLVLAQEVRDTERALQALCNLGYAALMQGDYERVTTLCGEALTTARDAEGGGMWHIPETLIDLGLASLQLGSYKQADATFKEALTTAQEVGIKPEVRHQVPREDPKDAMGPTSGPAECSTIVRGGLRQEAPVAYVLIDALELTEGQIEGLEYAINKEDNPVAGARRWASENREVVRPWIEAARNAR
jgi:tetratricopeptide (TPR) repeat protein